MPLPKKMACLSFQQIIKIVILGKYINYGFPQGNICIDYENVIISISCLFGKYLEGRQMCVYTINHLFLLLFSLKSGWFVLWTTALVN